MAESTRIMTSASTVASGLENNNRDLIDKNVQLKGALANTYSKVIETLRYFYSILKILFLPWSELEGEVSVERSKKSTSEPQKL